MVKHTLIFFVHVNSIRYLILVFVQYQRVPFVPYTDGWAPMRSVVETIPCNGVKLFMQMTHECLWAY